MIGGYFAPRALFFEEYQKLYIFVRKRLVLKMECDHTSCTVLPEALKLEARHWKTGKK